MGERKLKLYLNHLKILMDITKPKRKKMPADTTDEKQKNEVQTPTKVTKVQKPSGDEQFEEMVNNMPV